MRHREGALENLEEAVRVYESLRIRMSTNCANDLTSFGEILNGIDMYAADLKKLLEALGMYERLNVKLSQIFAAAMSCIGVFCS